MAKRSKKNSWLKDKMANLLSAPSRAVTKVKEYRNINKMINDQAERHVRKNHPGVDREAGAQLKAKEVRRLRKMLKQKRGY